MPREAAKYDNLKELAAAIRSGEVKAHCRYDKEVVEIRAGTLEGPDAVTAPELLYRVADHHFLYAALEALGVEVTDA